MKRCPTCDKTFADGMKFCQTDGTLLVEDAAPADPYKTVVGNQSDIQAAIPPVDPFKTMVAGSPKAANDDDLLQLPDEPDLLKTKVVSHNELFGESNSVKAEDVPKLDLPPAPTGNSAPLIEPKPPAQSDFAPAPPKFNEPSLSPPSFGASSSPEPPPSSPPFSDAGSTDATAVFDANSPAKNPLSPFDSKPFPNDFSAQSPYGNQENKPIPSPFQDSPPNYQPPHASPFDAAQPPFKEAEPKSGERQEFGNQSAFQPPSPFGNAEPFNSPMQQTEWTPPPAPVSEWQNQDLGANTPFQPPPATSGQDQTLAIVSLVCGILSIICCGAIAGIPALITGFMAKNNADANPNQYGGRGLALAGMILGGISVFFTIIYILYIIFVGFAL